MADDLESIIRETEAPKRVKTKKEEKVRTAKFTSRTHKSLKDKIKNGWLKHAYKRYNKKYSKMVKALEVAEDTRDERELDSKISNSEVVMDYDVAASYNKKLAKYGARLLRDDIKRVVKEKDVKPKPIRVPRILAKRLRGITGFVVRQIEKYRKYRQEKALYEEIRDNTKEYIESSLEGAIFEDRDNGKLREEIATDVIKGLQLNRRARGLDNKIENLRNFISEDGKTPIIDDSDELFPKAKTKKGTVPVPPISGDGKKEDVGIQLTDEDVLGGPKTKGVPASVPPKSGDGKKTDATQLTDGDIYGVPKVKGSNGEDLTIEPPVETKKDDATRDSKVSARIKKEVDTICTISDSIEKVREQQSKVSDPRVKEQLENYIALLTGELEKICNSRRNSSTKKPRKTDSTSEEIPREVTKVEESGVLEPVEVKPSYDVDNLTEEELVRRGCTVLPPEKHEKWADEVKYIKTVAKTDPSFYATMGYGRILSNSLHVMEDLAAGKSVSEAAACLEGERPSVTWAIIDRVDSFAGCGSDFGKAVYPELYSDTKIKK